MTGVPPSFSGGDQVRVMADGETSVASGLPGASGTSGGGEGKFLLIKT